MIVAVTTQTGKISQSNQQISRTFTGRSLSSPSFFIISCNVVKSARITQSEGCKHFQIKTSHPWFNAPLVNLSEMSFSLYDNLVSKEGHRLPCQTELTVALCCGGWKQSPCTTDTAAPQHTNSPGGVAVLCKCQKHTPDRWSHPTDSSMVRESTHRCQSHPANYPNMGSSAPLPVQEYWKFNISKCKTISTALSFFYFILFETHDPFSVLYFLIGNIY